MKGWQRERELRRVAQAAQAAGGTLVGQPKAVARMLVAILDNGSAQVGMPDNIDLQFALIGRALTAVIVSQIQRGNLTGAPAAEPEPAAPAVVVDGE